MKDNFNDRNTKTFIMRYVEGGDNYGLPRNGNETMDCK